MAPLTGIKLITLSPRVIKLVALEVLVHTAIAVLIWGLILFVGSLLYRVLIQFMTWAYNLVVAEPIDVIAMPWYVSALVWLVMVVVAWYVFAFVWRFSGAIICDFFGNKMTAAVMQETEMQGAALDLSDQHRQPSLSRL